MERMIIIAEYIVENDIECYDSIEKYDDCTVEILINTKTGEQSIGWWQNGGWYEIPEDITDYDFPSEKVLITTLNPNDFWFGQQIVGYLCCNKNNNYYWAHDSNGIEIEYPTHWRYLPSLPEIKITEYDI